MIVLVGLALPPILLYDAVDNALRYKWVELQMGPATYQPDEDKEWLGGDNNSESEPESAKSSFYAELLHANKGFDNQFAIQDAYEGEELDGKLAHLREQMAQLSQAGILPETLLTAVMTRFDADAWEMAYGRGDVDGDMTIERQIVMRTEEIWLFQMDLSAATGKAVAFSVNINWAVQQAGGQGTVVSILLAADTEEDDDKEVKN